jgi:coenzyme F420 hydrogenase subunit beta
VSSVENVVKCGSCVGCGACSTATGGAISLTLTPYRTYEANLDGVSEQALADASAVCPFSDETPDEDVVSAQVFPVSMASDPRVGKHLGAYAGRILDDIDIRLSSSGGLTTWLLAQLLSEGHVDGIVHVGAGDDVMFEYQVSRSVEELRARRKSQYFPVNFAAALDDIKGDGLRYAFVGIPCAVKAMRHLMAQDAGLQWQIPFVVGIVCGHLKSMAYAESFAWQLGVAPRELASVDFRVKDPERTSREYGFRAVGQDGTANEAKTMSLLGGSWGHAVFQLGACDFCDDIFAENADVVFGDAWLARYEIEWQGTNVVVTRNEVIDGLLRAGRSSNQLMLDDLSVDNVAATQAGNFRHRRDGLAVRLHDDHNAGQWTPKKRVQPSLDGVDAERRDLIRKRRSLSRTSHRLFLEARDTDDLQVYMGGMQPLIDDYQAGTKMAFSTRLKNKAKRETWKLIAKARARTNRG